MFHGGGEENSFSAALMGKKQLNRRTSGCVNERVKSLTALLLGGFWGGCRRRGYNMSE